MSSVMMERSGMAMQGMSVSGMGAPVGAPTGMPAATNWMMVPRCTLKIEECPGGMKISCSTSDKMACSMMQNLCTMLAGGMCSCCMMMNGMTCCSFNFMMGLCKFEMTDSGFCMTCTSGDPQCCEMIQACCECISCCCDRGCTCCFMI